MDYKTSTIIGISIAVAVLAIGLVTWGVTSHNDKKLSNNTVTNFTLTREQVLKFMIDTNGVPSTASVGIADETYALAAEDWLVGAFSDAYGKFIFQLHENSWKAEENDCDDFARGCAFFAQLLHHNTVKKLQNDGIAVGEFWYVKDEGDGHAINFAIVRVSPDKLKLMFYEPQTQKQIVLSTKEIHNCLFWRI